MEMLGQLLGESMGSDKNESKLRSAFHRWRRNGEAAEPGGKVQKHRVGNVKGERSTE